MSFQTTINRMVQKCRCGSSFHTQGGVMGPAWSPGPAATWKARSPSVVYRVRRTISDDDDDAERSWPRASRSAEDRRNSLALYAVHTFERQDYEFILDSLRKLLASSSTHGNMRWVLAEGTQAWISEGSGSVGGVEYLFFLNLFHCGP